MSFYLGAIFKNSAFVVSDRMVIDERTGVRTTSNPRVLRVNDWTVFVPAGIMLFAPVMHRFLSQWYEENRIIDLTMIPIMADAFRTSGSLGVYEGFKKETLRWMKDCGKDTEYVRFDCLVAGVTTTGRSYLISLSDSTNFAFEVLTEPLTVAMIPPECEEAEKSVAEILRQLFRNARNQPEAAQMELVKQYAPSIVKTVGASDKNVSQNGDLVLMGKHGVSIVPFRSPLFKAT